MMELWPVDFGVYVIDFAIDTFHLSVQYNLIVDEGGCMAHGTNTAKADVGTRGNVVRWVIA